MFGGYGIYKCGIIIGIIVQNELYFKVDKESVKHYEDTGSKPFIYNSKGKKVRMSYWQVPLEIMADENLIGVCMESTWQASLN